MNYQRPIAAATAEEPLDEAASSRFPDYPAIAVLGLGYVGLPLAVAFAQHFITLGFDLDAARVAELRGGLDRTGEIDAERLAKGGLSLHSDVSKVGGVDIYIIAVPTPVDHRNAPDLEPLMEATRQVAAGLDSRRPTVIVFESTVYPGVTEDICGPLIESVSGLRRGEHFFLGYSPERINPGDREHTIDRILKVVAGENPEVTDYLARIYGRITAGGTFRAKSIKAAEAAKVIENAQRDINIAFMNEITQIFAKLGISALDVLEAAGTKWNFLKFRPGLVGGHCIGVDPYYLSHCAQGLGHLPRVILAGRSINDGMGAWIADTIHSLRGSRTGTALVLGLTFKENVPDTRNSKVVDLVRRLEWLGHQVTVHDPLADPAVAERHYGITLAQDAFTADYDVIVVAVAHRHYRELAGGEIERLVKDGGLLADLYGIWRGREIDGPFERWSL